MWANPARINSLPVIIAIALVAILAGGCSGTEVKPVDIYPEDMCAYCRMAFSDQRYASEVVSDRGEAFKFDDIGCMVDFQRMHKEVLVAAIFYKDFGTKRWISAVQATIVETNVATPMGSGKVAFAEKTAASEFQRLHPKISP
jgi:copper chaperone NosL